MKKILLLLVFGVTGFGLFAQTPYDTVNVYDPQNFTEMTTIDPANFQFIGRKNSLNRRVHADTMRNYMTPAVVQAWLGDPLDSTDVLSSYWRQFVTDSVGRVWYVDADGDAKMLKDTTITGVSDGDKGDVTVSGSGSIWNIDAGVVGANEIASTAVTPGSYTNTSLTVDADGRITAASNGAAIDSSIYKLLPVRSVTIDPNNFDLQIGTPALNNTGEFEFYALNAQSNDVGIYAGSRDSSSIAGSFPAEAGIFTSDGNVLLEYRYPPNTVYNVAMFGDSMFMGAYPGADLGLHIDDLPRDPQDTLSLLLVQDWVTRRVYRRDASTLGGGQTLFKVENSATDATVGTTNNYHVGKLGIGNFTSDVLGASLHIYNTDATITLSDSTSTDSTATPQIKFFRGHNASQLGRVGYLSTGNTDLYMSSNTANGKLTFQTEGATVAQLLPSGQLLLPEYGDTTFTGTAVKYLAVTDAGNVIEADAGDSAPAVSNPSVSTTTAINFQSFSRGIFDIDLTGVLQTQLVFSNPVDGGEYRLWLDGANSDNIIFPANALAPNRDSLKTRQVDAPRVVECFYDGANYICEDTVGLLIDTTTFLDTVLLAGMVAWYEGDDIAQANNSAVSLWSDISGNGNHLAQDTTGKQPTYKTATLNGHAVVDFDGSDDWMWNAGSLVLDTINRTFFIVAKSDDAGTSSSIMLFNDGSEETAGTAGQFGLTNEIAIRIDGGNRIWTANLVSGDGWDMIVVQLGTSSTNGTSTSDVLAWVNGSALTVSSTSALTLDTDDTFFSVGRKTSDFSQVFSFFNGQIAELLAYERALTTTERTKIQTYLTNKYGAF